MMPILSLPLLLSYIMMFGGNHVLGISGTWQQIGSDIDGTMSGELSGFSVSFSNDGTVLAVGAPLSGGSQYPNRGRVRVYWYNGFELSWQQLGSDIDGETGDQLGYSVSLSTNGTRLAVGAVGNGAGHVRVYEYNAVTWQQIGSNIEGETVGDQSGFSVSLSGDGSILAVGARYNDGNGADAGHVVVYGYNGGIWEQRGSDIDGEAAGDWSGYSVSLSSDGWILAIGAPKNDGAGSNAAGHVRVYEYTGVSWAQMGSDINGENALDQSGISVSLNSDGTILAVGSSYGAGYVRVYEYSGAQWLQIGSDIDGETSSSSAGASVSLSGDGTILAVGADGSSTDVGYVRVVEYNEVIWQQISSDINGENYGDYFGFSVSLSGDGTVLAVGAPWNDGGAGNGGHVRCFDFLTPAPTSAPSFPSISPSLSPTPAPSLSPTAVPSLSPTTAPLSNCIAYNNDTKNDGYDEEFDLNFENYAWNRNKSVRFVTSDINYIGQRIDCSLEDCLIQCNLTAFCTNLNVDINNVTDNNVMLWCEEDHSCSSASIFTSRSVSGVNISVICSGRYSCINMNVTITNFSSFHLYCTQFSSCLDVYINIDQEMGSNHAANNDGIIECVSLNSCDNLLIMTTSNKTQLLMHQFSEDVILNNGVGYLYDVDNILCNTEKFIKYQNTANISNDYVSNLILNEYNDLKLPCDDVQVICGNYSCSMEYTIIEPMFLNSLTTNKCYWLKIDYFQRISCKGECVSSPTSPPTFSPTSAPTSSTLAPSNAPTSNPSVGPSVAPTGSPSDAPSLNPSVVPSVSPTDSPSNAPTKNPIASPTFSPSQAPTRFPTLDITEIYDTTIHIKYVLSDLDETNTKILEDQDQSVTMVSGIISIIESGYFVANDILYKDFMIQILNVNGFVDFSDIALKDGQPITIESNILSDQGIAGVLIKKSRSSVFEEDVTLRLRNYFGDGSMVNFAVDDAKSLEYTTGDEEKQDTTVIMISIGIVTSGALTSGMAFLFNKIPITKVDNAAFLVPLLVSLNIYDFISDINLSIQIFKNNKTVVSITDILFLLGILSAVFIVLPFIMNISYAMRINSQKTIRECPSARAWFAKHLAQFMLLCIFSAGTYPILSLTSSRLFGLDFFNAGLLSSDLHELSKIKIKSTIFMENLPQLLIQMVYSYVIGKLENATILAFIASSLSVIASVVIYQAQREQNSEITITKYFIRLYTKNAITDDDQHKIKFNKGKKTKMGASLCSSFNVSKKTIEVGFVTQNDYGCVIHVQHSIFQNDLKSLKNKLLLSEDQRMINRGYKIDITEDMYIVNMFKLQREDILTGLVQHFDLDEDDDYMVSYHETEHETDIVTTLAKQINMSDVPSNMNSVDGENKYEGDDNNNLQIEMMGNKNNIVHYSDNPEMNEIKQLILSEMNEIKQLKQLILSGTETKGGIL